MNNRMIIPIFESF